MREIFIPNGARGIKDSSSLALLGMTEGELNICLS
jgi:hypothetical protein